MPHGTDVIMPQATLPQVSVIIKRCSGYWAALRSGISEAFGSHYSAGSTGLQLVFLTVDQQGTAYSPGPTGGGLLQAAAEQRLAMLVLRRRD